MAVRVPKDRPAKSELAEKDRKIDSERQAREQAVTNIENDSRFRDSVTKYTGFGFTESEATGDIAGTYNSLSLRARSLAATHFPFVTGVGDVLPADVQLRDANFPTVTGRGKVLPSAVGVGWGQIDNKPTDYPTAWGQVSGKPDTFKPAAHNQGWGTITGKPLGGPQNDYALRQIAGNGNAGSAAASNHTHSISAKHVSDEARRILLSLRQKARVAAKNTGSVTRGEFRDLCGMVLGLCHLALDDEDITAEEREEKLKDAAYRESFEKTELEYDDAETGETERRVGRFNTDLHPDLEMFG